MFQKHHRKIRFEDFENCIRNDKNYHVTNYSLISKHHNIQFVKTEKNALNNYFDKGYLLKDGIEIYHLDLKVLLMMGIILIYLDITIQSNVYYFKMSTYFKFILLKIYIYHILDN